MHSESADFLGGLRPVRHRGQEEQVRSPTKFESICGKIRLIAVINVGSVACHSLLLLCSK